MKSKSVKEYGANEFRAELVRIMPGYNWTVHKQSKHSPDYFEATGIQSSGFNRLSTLSVERRANDTNWKGISYTVRSAGHGAKARFEKTATDRTLARALRELQDIYTRLANHNRGLAASLEIGRKAKGI